MNAISRWSALVDFYELYGIAFSFPEEALGEAVARGAFFDDAIAIAEDLGVEDARAIVEPQGASRYPDGASALSDLRRVYSQLYLEPGRLRRIYPYESAFLFAGSHESGMPTLMVTRAAMDVERYMRQARALPADRLTHPVDSIENEFALLAAMGKNVLLALSQGDEAVAAEWGQLAVAFKESHLDLWVPQFMERTMDEAPESFYGRMACLYRAIGRKEAS